MDPEREPGRTFAANDIGWIDFEVKSSIDIKAGTYKYMTDADAIICAFAIGNGEVRRVTEGFKPVSWARMPDDFKAHHKRVVAGKAKWCAWNASFDRAAWNYATADFSYAEPEYFIDAMAQAVISGLPPGLKLAARFSGSTQKLESGKDLIRLFCVPGATATPLTHPREWAEFCAYALGDIVSMREVFQTTRQLPLAEWKEYWAMERINQRGVEIDLEMVQHAVWLAHEDKRRSAVLLTELTDGAVETVDQVAALTRWLLSSLPVEGRDILLKRAEEIDEDGILVRPSKFSLTRSQVERLIVLLTAKADPAYAVVLRVLQLRLYGGSKSPAKFQKISAQHVKGVLYNQYVFSGASQTGRASSKGVQIHNLTRNALAYEYEAIVAILDKCPYEHLQLLGDDSPVARKLALLIRPAFVPGRSNVFVWSDWSNIEARVLPWLCDHIEGAAKRVQLFRAIDADPSLPDLYTRTTSGILNVPIAQVTKETRQIGKVAELALGFLGGVNSLLNMGAALGVHFSDDEAQQTVERWRNVNPWAAQFGQQLWDAMLLARDMSGEFCPAGRCGFIFKRDFLGGSMLMRLPSGRFLTYRAWYWEMVAEKDDDGKVVGHKRELTYGRGYGRAKLWKGTLVENATQAVAADVLRGTLVRLEREGFLTRLHTHDEVLIEAPEADAGQWAEALRWWMQHGFEWSGGLPLMSEETIAPYYTKAKLPKLSDQESTDDRQPA